MQSVGVYFSFRQGVTHTAKSLRCHANNINYQGLPTVCWRDYVINGMTPDLLKFSMEIMRQTDYLSVFILN